MWHNAGSRSLLLAPRRRDRGQFMKWSTRHGAVELAGHPGRLRRTAAARWGEPADRAGGPDLPPGPERDGEIHPAEGRERGDRAGRRRDRPAAGGHGRPRPPGDPARSFGDRVRRRIRRPRDGGGEGDLPPGTFPGRRFRDPFGGDAAPGADRTGACPGVGHPPARRAHQPPGHRRHRLARELPAPGGADASLRHARPDVPPETGDADRGARPREAPRLGVRLRHVPRAPGGGPCGRKRAAGAFRQEARGGGDVDPPGREGAGHPERGAGTRAGEDARGAAGAAGAGGHGPHAGAARRSLRQARRRGPGGGGRLRRSSR